MPRFSPRLAAALVVALPVGVFASAFSQLLAHSSDGTVIDVPAVRGAAVVVAKQAVELPVVRYASFGRYRTADAASYDLEGRAGSLRRHGYLVVDRRVRRKSCSGQECYDYELEFRPRGADAGARLPRVVRHSSPAEYGSLEAASYALERRKGMFRDEGFVVLDEGVMNDSCWGARTCHSFRIDMVPELE